MFRIIIILAFITGCSTAVIPKTSTQFQVVGYSQIVAVTNEVYDACQTKVISKETCIDLFDNIKTAKSIIDSGVGSEKAADILTYIKGKL